MRRHLGKARYPAIVLLAVVVVALFIRVQWIEKSKARAAMMVLLPTAGELASALIRTGLNADALAAAGISPSSVNTVVIDVLDHLGVNQMAIELADAAHADAKLQANQLKRVIQSGQATSDQITAYPVATVQLSQCKMQCQALLDDVVNTAISSLTNSQKSTLAAIRANRQWDLPSEFLVVDREEADWVHLRDCLANERIAEQLEEDPDPDAQAALAEYRSDPAVATATTNLDINLSVVTAVWDQAVGD